MKRSKETRFLIVGAGPAGLTAAEYLRKKGYGNITLLEKEAYPGGKCLTTEYEGRNYELGAGIVSANNSTIMNLVEEFNIPLTQLEFTNDNLFDTQTGGICEDTFSLTEKISYFWQLLLRYHRLTLRFPGVQHPGFVNCEQELFENFHDWAIENNIPLVKDNFERFFTGFGYGYWEEIPAAYTLKYNDWASLVSFVKREIYIFPEGIQQLWQQIAALHNVHYKQNIHHIRRKKEKVTIDTGLQQYTADVLLLTCPLDETIHFMDVTETEKELFSKIKYTDYRTYVCRLKNFPNRTGFIPANFHPTKKGHPVFWYKRYPDTDIFTLYVLSDFTVTDEIILQNLETTVAKLGGELLRIEQVIKWKYFPHVDTKEMQNGFYSKLENLQGINNTWYLGEIMNFSTVELSAAYSVNLVERFF